VCVWKIKEHHPTLETIIDDHEQQVQTASSLPVANTFYSQYKHRHTLKLFGAITPSGYGLALDTVGRDLDEAEPRPGRCTDADMIEECRWPDRVSPGYVTQADKGILVHSLFAKNHHSLETPFKKRRNVPGFCETGMVATEGTARVRIHIERFFERVQDFKVTKKVIKVTEMDIYSSIWSVIYHMSNFDVDIIRQGRPGE
jgi:hypothetical protein